jgi:hypothetical protein
VIQFVFPRCPIVDDFGYWSGDYCEIKVRQPFDLEKFKMILAFSVIGAITLVCILSLLLCLIYKRRQQKKIRKKYVPAAAAGK